MVWTMTSCYSAHMQHIWHQWNLHSDESHLSLWLKGDGTLFGSLVRRPAGVCINAKFHYTDTGYGHVVQHHQRTKICHIAMPEPNISTCQDVAMWQIFVRWW